MGLVAAFFKTEPQKEFLRGIFNVYFKAFSGKEK